MSPKRASSKAITFSGFLPRRASLWTVLAKFFEGLLLLLVGPLMPRTTRLELDFASPEKLADTVGVSVLDAMALSQELVGLADGGDLPSLHGLL